MIGSKVESFAGRPKIGRSARYLLTAAVATAVAIAGFASPGISQQKTATPQKGGVLRIVTSTGPKVLGWYPEMGPGDASAVYPAIERVMDMSANREMEPFLAESVKVDQKNLTMTIKLRKGIKFHDGSDMNAEAVAWNYKTILDPTRKVKFSDKIKSIETPDSHTVVLHLTEYNNLMLSIFGWIPVFSKAAFDTHGKEWCRANPVGTGPFKFVEWKRDVSMKWERNPNYWQKGLPYLDGMEYSYVPDATTASAMFQSKQADVWIGAPVKDQAELVKKGFKRQSAWAGLPPVIYLNTANPKAVTANLKVREAIEYALDRPAMAKALGFGFYSPMKMVAPEGEWGYSASYKGRPYDPEKAKKLLAEAGYPNGCKIKLLALTDSTNRTTSETIKAYLDQAGFNVDLDLADSGRFFGNVWGSGWDDMVLFFIGMDMNFYNTVEFWLGHSPRTKLASFKQPPELLAMSEQAVKYFKAAEQKAVTEKMVRLVADEALVVPLFFAPAAFLTQPYVHSTYYHNGFIRWTLYQDWMEKH
jgi:peptide/nickel transport system substrate-binding protein